MDDMQADVIVQPKAVSTINVLTLSETVSSMRALTLIPGNVTGVLRPARVNFAGTFDAVVVDLSSVLLRPAGASGVSGGGDVDEEEQMPTSDGANSTNFRFSIEDVSARTMTLSGCPSRVVISAEVLRSSIGELSIVSMSTIGSITIAETSMTTLSIGGSCRTDSSRSNVAFTRALEEDAGVTSLVHGVISLSSSALLQTVTLRCLVLAADHAGIVIANNTLGRYQENPLTRSQFSYRVVLNMVTLGGVRDWHRTQVLIANNTIATPLSHTCGQGYNQRIPAVLLQSVGSIDCQAFPTWLPGTTPTTEKATGGFNATGKAKLSIVNNTFLGTDTVDTAAKVLGEVCPIPGSVFRLVRVGTIVQITGTPTLSRLPVSLVVSCNVLRGGETAANAVFWDASACNNTVNIEMVGNTADAAFRLSLRRQFLPQSGWLIIANRVGDIIVSNATPWDLTDDSSSTRRAATLQRAFRHRRLAGGSLATVHFVPLSTKPR